MQGALNTADITPKGLEVWVQNDQDVLIYNIILYFHLIISCIKLLFFSYFSPRAADGPAELVWEHLQSEQHHQSLQRRQPEGTGGQEEEEEELGEEKGKPVQTGHLGDMSIYIMSNV